MRVVPHPTVTRLIAVRKAAGLTQAEVAARLRTAPSQISLWESGARDPRLQTLGAWARVLGQDVTTTDINGGGSGTTEART